MLFTRTPSERGARVFGGVYSSRSLPHETDVLSLNDSTGAAWVQAYNVAWLGRRWSGLEKMLAPDITLMSTNFAQAIVGREAVLNYLRALMQRTYVHEYAVADLKGYTSGSVGIITYRWQLDRTVARERRSGAGRDILVLKSEASGWQLTWRGQTVRQRPGSIADSSWPSTWE
jgi:Domain of unknown function (DUF4440)